MGFFAELRAKRQAKKLAQQHEIDDARWQLELDALKISYDLFSKAATGQEPPDHQLVQKKGEILLWTGQGIFHEAGRTPSQFVGSSAGFSIPIGAGVRFRTGSFQARVVPGNEMQIDKDSGIVKITNQRLIFAGGVHTSEWQFSKLLSASRNQEGNDFLLSVSNRKKTSGVKFSLQDGVIFSRILALALHSFEEGIPATLTAIEGELKEIEKKKPKLIL